MSVWRQRGDWAACCAEPAVAGAVLLEQLEKLLGSTGV
jgi:hypothetical protein